jgi:hypothetical protein
VLNVDLQIKRNAVTLELKRRDCLNRDLPDGQATPSGNLSPQGAELTLVFSDVGGSLACLGTDRNFLDDEPARFEFGAKALPGMGAELRIRLDGNDRTAPRQVVRRVVTAMHADVEHKLGCRALRHGRTISDEGRSARRGSSKWVIWSTGT